MSMESPESPKTPPPWLPQIRRVLDELDAGTLDTDLAPSIIAASCEVLILDGKLRDFGQLFLYLWARDSPVLPIAKSFVPEEGSNLICIDPATREPRMHGLIFEYADKARALIDELGMLPEHYAEILTNTTGVIIRSRPKSTDT